MPILGNKSNMNQYCSKKNRKNVLPCGVVLWICILTALPPSAWGQARIDPEAYLNQLQVERQESWIQSQLRRFTNYRYLSHAYQLMQSLRFDEAKEEFERYLSNDPLDLEARANYLHLLYRLKDYDNVIKQADIILGKSPAYIPARMYRGFAYQSLGALEEALEDFRRISVTPEATPVDRVLALNMASDLAILLNRYSDSLESMRAIPEENRDGVYWFRKGLTEERSGNPTAAFESYHRAIRSSQDIPFKVTVHRTIVSMAIREEKWGAAADELKAALELLPGDPELTLSYQRLSFDTAMRNGRYEDALAIAENLARDSKDSADWMRVGVTLEKLGRWEEAVGAFSQAEAFAGDKSQKIIVWRSVAEAAKKAEDWPMTERALLNLQKLEPGKPETLRGLSVLAYQQKKLADAIRWMEMSLSVKEDLDDREFLANLYTEAGDYDHAIEARTFILRGVRTPSDRHRNYMSLGYVYSLAGRADEAAATFSSAAELNQDFETLVPLAQALEDAGKLQEAVKYRRRIVSIRPDGENHFALAMLYLKLGQEAPALQELETAVHTDMDDSVLFIALKQLASLYWKQGHIDKAEKTLSRAQSLNSEDSSIPLMLAEIALNAGDHASALENVNRALHSGETFRRLRLRSLIYQKMGDFNKARKDYEKALSLLPQNHPDSSSFQIEIGNLEYGAKRYPEAAKNFLRAFELDPEGAVGPLVQAAESLALARDWNAALDVNRKIVSLPQTPPELKGEAYRRLGIIYGRLKQPRLAEESYRNALSINDADIRTYEDLGMLLFEQKRFDEARNIFSARIEKQDSAKGMLYLARTYAAMGKPGMGIHYLEQALAESSSLDPVDRDSLYRELGSLYAENHQYAKASEVWMRSENLARTPEIQLRLARMQRMLGNYREAQEILLALDETELPLAMAVEYQEEIALCYYQQGQDDRTIEHMTRAISMESTPSRHYILGLAHRRSNDLEKAIVHLKEASDLQPLNDEYALALGYALHNSGRRKEAVPILETVATRSPDYLNVVKDLGYFQMQDSNNSSAVHWFRKAIDNGPLYPQRTEKESLDVRRELYRMRSEIHTLNNRFDLTAYGSYRSNSISGAASVLGGGVLPSNGGLEISYRPPRIGYRAGRMFQITARVLGNAEPESIRPDWDSVQAGIGVRYKPLPKWNLFLSGERIIKLGANTNNGWLWRGMFSWTRGRDLTPGGFIRNYSLVYADAGYFTPNDGMAAVYSEFHQGVAFRIRPNALLKPHIVVDGRYQSRDTYLGTYVEAGGGLSLQFDLFESQYETHRVGLEFLGQYKRSWLQPNPQSQEDRISDGWTFTSILLF